MRTRDAFGDHGSNIGIETDGDAGLEPFEEEDAVLDRESESGLEDVTSVHREMVPRRGLGGFEAVLAKQGGNDLDHALLFAARQLPNLIEELLHLARGSSFSDGSSGLDEVLDTTSEDPSERRKDVGTRWFLAALPEGDVGLRLVEEARELGLTEALRLAQSDQPAGLLWSWSSEFSRHTRIVGDGSRIEPARSTLRRHRK